MAITDLPTPPSRATPAAFSTLADAFIAALPTFVTEANAQAAALDLNDTIDASSSSVAIGLGAKTFTVTAGKSFQPGMYLVIADDAAPSTNSMIGQITSYSGTTLVINITKILGGGTKSAWTISQSVPFLTDDPIKGALIRPKFVYTETLKYDGGTVIFVEGETVTGAGGGTGVVVAVDGNATSGYLFLNTRNAVAFVNDEALTGSGTGAAVANGASTKDSIVIYPGSYNHVGTKTQTVSWASKIGFRFGSGGSNAGSVNLDASNWFYLYIDDSAVVTAGTDVLTDSEFVANKTCPSFSDAKVGEYTGNDRCIFGTYSNSGSEIDEFFHDGGDVVMWADDVENQAAVDIDTAWTDINALRIPSFATIGFVIFKTNAATIWNWRTNGQTGTIGKHAVAAFAELFMWQQAITDSAQIVELKASVSNASTIACWTGGWKLPTGM